MKQNTTLTRAGRKPFDYHGTVNTPVFQTSTVLFKTLAEYEAAGTLTGRDSSYGIAGTATTFDLEDALKELEGGEQCILTPSGLSAITLVLSSLLQAGDHLLMTDTTYGPTRRFCTKELKKNGIETTYYDPLIGEGIANLIRPNTKLIFMESPGSLTFEVQDVPAIVKVARAREILTAIDNSWASPLYFKPLDFDVDISILALTKYVGGHSDIMMGSITTKDEKLGQKLAQSFRNFGLATSPQDCALAARGLRSLGVRLEKHAANALNIASWLESQNHVTKVLYPPLPSNASHALWARDFTGANGLLTFLLDRNYDDAAVYNFVDNMRHFAIGCSWGGYESLILRINPETTRTATKWQPKETTIRIHVGLEDVEDLKEDLAGGLGQL